MFKTGKKNWKTGKQKKIQLKIKYLWWLVRISRPNFEAECKLAVPVETLRGNAEKILNIESDHYLVRIDDHLEAEQIVRIRELSLAGLRQLQFVNILQVQLYRKY